MDHTDKKAFKELMDGLSEYYQKSALGTVALKIYFDALSRFEFGQITQAVSKHVQGPTGQFYPKAADIISLIEGGSVTTDEVISAARLADSPFGVLCRIQIGSWDLDNQTDMFYLKQRAQECIDKLPEWKAMAAQGAYSDHQISIMIKRGVNPLASFRAGLPALNSPDLRNRIETITKTQRHQFLIGEIDEVEFFNLEVPALEKLN